ncbi:hypothetical protein [Amycolatopsis sp. NPDC006125]|uniref:hypothetical protein n=1 Tax=Amycolatopsis sp. NPDC006125 TaxID=3156730 RepID=UPI0033BE540C
MAEVIAGVDATDVDLFLLPERIADNGDGLYPEDLAGLPKTARASGIDLQFSHHANARRYLGEYTASEIWLSIGLGIVGNLSTDLIKLMYRTIRIKAKKLALENDVAVEEVPVRLKIAAVDLDGEKRRISGVEITGRSAAVEGLLDSLVDWPNRENRGKIEAGGDQQTVEP